MARRVGGQAVVEGVLMMANRIVVAVRRKDGEVVVEELGRIRGGVLKKIPLVRGIVNLYYSLYYGILALTRSAEIAFDEEMKKSEGFFSVFLSLLLAIGLFFLLPMFLTELISQLRGNEFLFSLVEGSIRIGILLAYVWVISLMKDVRRLFEYHGAEHKTINAYESGEELLPENVMRYSRIHPRCGTNFLMIFLISAVLLFSLLSIFFKPTLTYRIVSRSVLIPVIASISYEFLILFSKLPEPVGKILVSPGLLLQRLTTREPDGDQIEVAIRALEEALKGEDTEVEIMA